MEAVQRRCCGIDVHKKKLTVYVLPPQGHTESQPLEREFGTFTRDLRGLREWLKECGANEAVMEATGQYWRPVWNVLEEEIPGLMLVNPQHVKALAGRKTDRIDSKRLARYLERGELVGSFIPSRPVRELRDLTRARVHLVEEINRVKNRISALCEAGNLKVASVASDLFGVSGRRMLYAMAVGIATPAGWPTTREDDFGKSGSSCRGPWRGILPGASGGQTHGNGPVSHAGTAPRTRIRPQILLRRPFFIAFLFL